MNSILNKTKTKLNNKNVYITEKDDVYYLTRFKSSALSVFYVNGKWYALTDQRYFENATKSIQNMEVIDIADKTWVDRVFHNVKTIYVDSNDITVERFNGIQKAWAERDIEVIAEPFPTIRYGYSGEDVQSLIDSSSLLDEIFARVFEKIEVGMTEKDVEAIILKEVIDSKATGVSFDPIVAAGTSSSSPHWSPSDNVIKEGQLVTIDMGVVYKGFCSDMTRTFVVGGTTSGEEELIWDIVKNAMEESTKLIKPGITGKELDEYARKIIEDAGYGEYFTHGLGHAVGINVHEMPRINKLGTDPIKPGMVITIEPGIYIPGKYGVRIENSILVTEEGYQVLNKTPINLYKNQNN